MCGYTCTEMCMMVMMIVMMIMIQYTLSETTLSNPNNDEVLAKYPGQDEYTGREHVIYAGVGGRVDLPCHVTSPLPSDPALLILWYKRGHYKPIYSVDLRKVPSSHWREPQVLGSRGGFHMTPSPVLSIHRVTSADEGRYTCTVNFRTSQTIHTISNLTVIVPPRRLSIYTELGVEAGSVVGPYTEGDTLRLTCRATGGSPPPRVTWWEGDALLDLTSEVETLEGVSNTLVVASLTRRDLHRSLACHAANSNLTAPLITSVTLDMHFAPLWVRLMSSRDPLSANNAYILVCQAAGARPPSTITWHLQHQILNTHTSKTSEQGNVTTSELHFTPDNGDAGKILSCHAQSPALPTDTIIDHWKLQVYYKPVASLRPGPTLNLSTIEEGDDVYFECSIKANPSIYKVVWLHEGDELKHNVSAGIIISNQSLVLQGVSRSSSGNYYCVAANIEGDGRSNPVLLSVQYAPICSDPEVSYRGVARFEQVNITCHVDSYPKPSIYTWTFNNSGESIYISQDHIESGDSWTRVRYTPNTELDYGTLLCWATNAVGRQIKPCVFHVFPAGRPDPAHNCTSFNLSVGVVNVRCVAGFDGGLPQTFILQLQLPHTQDIIANTTSQVPGFSVSGLPSGVMLMGKVYSVNSKGRTHSAPFNVYTPKDHAERRTAAVKPSPTDLPSLTATPLGPVLGVVMGVVGGVVLVLSLICILVKLRRGRVRGERGERDGRCTSPHQSSPHHTSPKLPLPSSNDPNDQLTTAPDSPLDCDRNPDLIPLAECKTIVGRGITTISNSSVPHTYATLPRSHLCSHSHIQKRKRRLSSHSYHSLTTIPQHTTCHHHSSLHHRRGSSHHNLPILQHQDSTQPYIDNSMTYPHISTHSKPYLTHSTHSQSYLAHSQPYQAHSTHSQSYPDHSTYSQPYEAHSHSYPDHSTHSQPHQAHSQSYPTHSKPYPNLSTHSQPYQTHSQPYLAHSQSYPAHSTHSHQPTSIYLNSEPIQSRFSMSTHPQTHPSHLQSQPSHPYPIQTNLSTLQLSSTRPLSSGSLSSLSPIPLSSSSVNPLASSLSDTAPLSSSLSPAHLSSSLSPAPLSSTFSPAPLSSSFSPALLSSTFSPAHLSSTFSPAHLSSTFSPAPLSSTFSPAHLSSSFSPAHPSSSFSPAPPSTASRPLLKITPTRSKRAPSGSAKQQITNYNGRHLLMRQSQSTNLNSVVPLIQKHRETSL